MDTQTENYINEFRQKLDNVFNKFTVEDFKRVHAKFVGGVISIEVNFKKRFPEEYKIHMGEFYGPDSD